MSVLDEGLSSPLLTSTGTTSEEMLVSLLHDLCFWEPTPEGFGVAVWSKEKKASPLQTETERTGTPVRRNSQNKMGGQQDMNAHAPPPVQTTTRLESRDDVEVSTDTITWKKTVDPSTGRPYYYDMKTMKTQWEKPFEIRALERRRKKDQRKRDESFFREMEQNIMASIARGEPIPGVRPSELKPTGSPKEPIPLAHNGSIRARTISSMDESLLAELHVDSLSDAVKSGAVGSYLSVKPAPKAVAKAVSKTTTKIPVVSNTSAQSIPPLAIERRPPLPVRTPSLSDIPEAPVNEPQPDSFFEFSPDPPHCVIDPSQILDPDSLRGELLLDVTEDDEIFNGLSSNRVVAERPQALNVHMRRNTGGTIYMESTMSNPNVQATIKCVCGVYRAHIVQAFSRPANQRTPIAVSTVHVNLDLFRDNYEHSWRKVQETVPLLSDIELFYEEFFKRSQMEHDAIIMSLIYVERLIKETNSALSPKPENWKSVLFSSMILASKVWDDLSMWNVDFSNVSAASGLSQFSLQRINQLERAILTCLDYNVKVPASEYAKYYFLIRTMLMRSGHLEGDTLPLNKEEARLMEAKTEQYQESRLPPKRHPKDAGRRTKSVDWSWFGRSTEQTVGPVLKDTICLEQLVSMDR